MKDLSGLMKQAQGMQQKLQDAQAKLEETTVDGAAGSGLVHPFAQGLRRARGGQDRRGHLQGRRCGDPGRSDPGRPRGRQIQARRRFASPDAAGDGAPGGVGGRHAGAEVLGVGVLRRSRDRTADRAVVQTAGHGARAPRRRAAPRALEEAGSTAHPPRAGDGGGGGQGATLHRLRRPGHQRGLRRLLGRNAGPKPDLRGGGGRAPFGPWSAAAPSGDVTTCSAECCRRWTGWGRRRCAWPNWRSGRRTAWCVRWCWRSPPPSTARPPPTISPNGFSPRASPSPASPAGCRWAASSTGWTTANHRPGAASPAAGLDRRGIALHELRLVPVGVGAAAGRWPRPGS